MKRLRQRDETDNAKKGLGCACLCLGIDPGVLFNDSQIGHRVGRALYRAMEAERQRA